MASPHRVSKPPVEDVLYQNPPSLELSRAPAGYLQATFLVWNPSPLIAVLKSHVAGFTSSRTIFFLVRVAAAVAFHVQYTQLLQMEPGKVIWRNYNEVSCDTRKSILKAIP